MELTDKANHKQLSLQFKGDVLIGATSIGMTQHVGALRGLIRSDSARRSLRVQAGLACS